MEMKIGVTVVIPVGLPWAENSGFLLLLQTSLECYLSRLLQFLFSSSSFFFLLNFQNYSKTYSQKTSPVKSSFFLIFLLCSYYISLRPTLLFSKKTFWISSIIHQPLLPDGPSPLPHENSLILKKIQSLSPSQCGLLLPLSQNSSSPRGLLLLLPQNSLNFLLLKIIKHSW